MTVATILAGKGRNVVTASAATRVAEAVTMLTEHKIGALVVSEGAQRISGIISERDIVQALARGGAAILDGPVSAIMTRDVVTCGDGDSINQVMTEMTRGRFRHLPVVSGGRLAGIVSIGDVVKARIGEVEREAEEMRAYIAAT